MNEQGRRAGRAGTPEVTLDDVRAAASLLEGHILRTPAARSRTLSVITGADVVLKLENLQFTASFKERGARVKLESLDETQRRCGVIAMSAGNHAQAVAHHAAELGIDATIVMPAATPVTKISRTEDLGARVVLHGDDLGAATDEAWRLAESEGRTFVPPYDDPQIVAGQGTVALELLADVAHLDAIIVPVGGGGLVAGTAVVASELAPDCAVYGVQSNQHASMALALGDVDAAAAAAAGWGPTIAEGIAVDRPGDLPLRLVAGRIERMLTVSEAHIEEAVSLYLEIEKVVVEGAGAAPLAALLEHRSLFVGRTVGLIVTGGNIDLRLLASVIMRGLVRTGRLTRLRVEISDQPGSLGDLTAVVGRAGGNIVEVTHQRSFTSHSARMADVELVVETRDRPHAEALADELRRGGYAVSRQDP